MDNRGLWMWTSSSVATGVVIGVAVSHFLFAGSAAAQKNTADVITARAFHVVDAAGKVRVKLLAKPDGSAGLAVMTAAGTPSAMMLVAADSRPTIAFLDSSSTLRDAISVTEQGDLTMNVFDKKQQPAAAFVMSASGGPAINIVDKNGTVRARLGITNPQSADPTETNPSLLLLDKSGNGFFKAP